MMHHRFQIGVPVSGRVGMIVKSGRRLAPVAPRPMAGGDALPSRVIGRLAGRGVGCRDLAGELPTDRSWLDHFRPGELSQSDDQHGSGHFIVSYHDGDRTQTPGGLP